MSSHQSLEKESARIPEKIWEPRNKQAAFVVRKAKDEHRPIAEPKFLPSPAEIAAEQARVAAITYANLEKARQERAEARRLSKEQNPPKPPKPKVGKNMWVAQMARRNAKLRGLPPPTTEELRKLRASYPGFGEPIYKSP